MTVDTLISGGTVVTMDPDRRVLQDGAVAIRDTEIVAVGPTDRLTAQYTADRRIDASDSLVLPGLINTHVHVPDILYRGIGRSRRLHDWLFNIKRPLVGGMNVADHRVAAALYCEESLSCGVTTFVENAGGTGSGYSDEVIETKLDVYDALGVRNIYAHCFLDKEPDEEFTEFVATQERKEPSVAHVGDSTLDTEAALDTVESHIEAYHGTADGRQSVWPGPFLAGGTTPEALAGAYELADKYDVMTTTHTAETAEQEQGLATSVEYLESADYLGSRTLLGHCVQVSEADIQRLAETDTKVAHNIVTNCALGSGVAPVPMMQRYGVTVGLGTDNVDQNHTSNLINDMRFAAMVHKVDTGNPRILSPETVVEMATIDAARAIRRADDLGSLESGKLADVVVLDLDQPQLLPFSDVASAIVYQATGTEVETVLCNGAVVFEDGELVTESSALPDSRTDVFNRREALVERTGLSAVDGGEW